MKTNNNTTPKTRWHDNHGKGNMKGEVNGFEASYALAMLGTIVLDVAHVLHA